MACCHKSGGQLWTPITPSGGQSSTPIYTPTPAPPSAGPLTPIERWTYDYTALDHWMAETEQAIRHTRRTLDALARKDDPVPAGGMGSTDP